jgi:hypothetical protein
MLLTGRAGWSASFATEVDRPVKSAVALCCSESRDWQGIQLPKTDTIGPRNIICAGTRAEVRPALTLLHAGTLER